MAATAMAAPQCPWPGPVVRISTAQDLQKIGLCLPATGMTFWLDTSIDETGIEFKGFVGEFDGTFSGGGNIISNLTLATDGGLFDKLGTSGVIQSLALENIIAHGGSDHTYSYGALVNVSQGKISNVSILSGTVTGQTPSGLGGMVGKMIGGVMNVCTASIALAPGENAKYNGVLVGQQESGEIENSVSSGYMVLTGNADSNGGLVGWQKKNAVITRSSSSTNIDISNAKSAYGNGVLAGKVDGMIDHSFAHGSVIRSPISNAMFISGGAVGYLNDGNINEIYSSSTFPGGDPNADGGLVGLIPFAHNDISCTNSYWDSSVSGLPYSAACSDGGRSTELMQPAGPDDYTFLGWNTTPQNKPIWKFMKGWYPTLLP